MTSISGTCQDTVLLCGFDQYKVVEFNDKFQLIKGNKTIVEKPNNSDLRLKFNEESQMIFMDTSCLNCASDQLTFDSYYLRCNNNIHVEIIPINDSLRIVNHFKLSERCSNLPIRSKQYPDEDSIVGYNAMYPAFEFGFTQSCIRSNRSERAIPIPVAVEYDFISDILVGFELDLDLWGDVKKSWLHFYQFKDGTFTSKHRIEKKYVRYKTNVPYGDIHEISDQITDSRVLNLSNFAVKVQSQWYRYSYDFNRFGNNQLRLFRKESEGADSIQVIPFFEPAIIMHYADSSVLEISHSRISGAVRFDTLNISNYYAEGLETYVSKEIIVFTYTKNQHIIIYHSKGYPHYGKFKIYEGPDPKEFFDLERHRLHPDLTTTLQIIAINNKR